MWSETFHGDFFFKTRLHKCFLMLFSWASVGSGLRGLSCFWKLPQEATAEITDFGTSALALFFQEETDHFFTFWAR